MFDEMPRPQREGVSFDSYKIACGNGISIFVSTFLERLIFAATEYSKPFLYNTDEILSSYSEIEPSEIFILSGDESRPAAANAFSDHSVLNNHHGMPKFIQRFKIVVMVKKLNIICRLP